MNDHKKNLPAALAVLALTACGSEPNLDFGPLQLGMTEDQLTALNFECDDTRCEAEDWDGPVGEPDLGSKIDASARTKEGRVSSFEITTFLYDADEVIELYREAYGAPETCRYEGGFGAVIEHNRWETGDGASVAVNRKLQDGVLPTSFSGLPPLTKVTTVYFRDATETAEFKDLAC